MLDENVGRRDDKAGIKASAIVLFGSRLQGISRNR